MPRRHRHSSTSKRRGGSRVSPFVWIGLAAVVVIAAAIFALLPPQGLPLEVDAARAYQMVQQGATLIDVRTQQEYDEQHIPKSILIPLDELPGRLGEVPRDADVIVVCGIGTRSKEGASMLRASGYSRASCLRGGIRDWAAAGYPVEP